MPCQHRIIYNLLKQRMKFLIHKAS
uniref:Uncharacterized protein n=1 Tax=Lepeophtheirus salmonis TaxID=72036 RepID=A0A0K2TAZ0_LEPSM